MEFSNQHNQEEKIQISTDKLTELFKKKLCKVLNLNSFMYYCYIYNFVSIYIIWKMIYRIFVIYNLRIERNMNINYLKIINNE